MQAVQGFLSNGWFMPNEGVVLRANENVLKKVLKECKND